MDGGTTWTLGDLGVAGQMGPTAFLDSMTGWVVEQDCRLETRCNSTTTTMRVLRTDNGGVTWTQLSTLDLPSFLQTTRALRLRGSTLYLTGSGVAYRSLDGGVTWLRMDHPAIAFDSNVDFVDQNSGYTISKGDVLRTDDAGRSWTRVAAAPGGARFLVRFLDATTGFTTGQTCAAGSCTMTLWRTHNGGSAWEPVLTATGESAHSGDLQFLGRLGWVALARAVGSTSDGGSSWSQYPLPDGWSIQNFSIADATHLWATIGLADVNTTYPTYPTHSALASSTDSGQTWQIVRPLKSVIALVFVDREHGWYIDQDCSAGSCITTLFSTSDAGATWREQQLGFNQVYDITFADPVNGWASVAADCRDSCRFPLLHTANGGDTWVSQFSNGDAVAHDLHFVDARTGWFTTSPAQVFGAGGAPPQRTVLYHTTDAGGGPIGKKPVLPDLGTGAADGTGIAALLLLAAAGVAALATAGALQRRRA